MRIKQIVLSNFRCFESVKIDLENITVITGHNNSGKSSILKAILLLQAGTSPSSADVRTRTDKASIKLHCASVKIPRTLFSQPMTSDAIYSMEIQAGGGFSLSVVGENISQAVEQFKNQEPEHCIVPYLSKRKVQMYSEDVRAQFAATMSDMTHLSAKLARVTNPTFPGHQTFKDGCEKILGFMLTAVPSENGQKPGVYLSDGSTLTLGEMGEGVPNIAALLAELATAHNKIFVIEEPENDLHPTSLKSLLEIILRSAEHNQFIISTHSNIVTQYLAGGNNSLFYVEKEKIFPPTSSIYPVAPNVTARMAILRELGYSLSDFELWDGWLILEESSAERIIRDFLIPYFTPSLSIIRTLAAGGVDDVEATFNDFHRLVRFTHLEEIYRHSTWVKVDGDEAGSSIIRRLRESYVNWETSRFSQFKHAQFEHYYPKEFAQEVAITLSIQDKREKRVAKRELLNKVLIWLQVDHERAKKSLQESASEVIEFLELIASSMKNNKSRTHRV